MFSESEDILLHSDPNQESHFGTIFLSKSTDFNKILPVVLEISFLAIKKVLVVQDSIRDRILPLAATTLVFVGLRHFSPSLSCHLDIFEGNSQCFGSPSPRLGV